MPTVFLITGSTGAGKTKYARNLAREKGALVFSIDEWMKTLFWMDAPDLPNLPWALERVGRCEDQIWKVAKPLLEAGTPVILDLGFSKKEQRGRFKSLAHAAGHPSELHFLDYPAEIRRGRVRERNSTRSATFEFEVTEKMFDWMEIYFEPPGADELGEASVTIQS